MKREPRRRFQVNHRRRAPSCRANQVGYLSLDSCEDLDRILGVPKVLSQQLDRALYRVGSTGDPASCPDPVAGEPQLLLGERLPQPMGQPGARLNFAVLA